jgi:tetratricopeptide (TPR) repeat protein
MPSLRAYYRIGLTIAIAGAIGVVAAAQQTADDLRAALEEVRTLTESDPTAAVALLDRLAADARAIRASRPLTEIERALQRDLYVARARAYLQLLDNPKAEESFRELLRVEPLFTGNLAPLEQEMLAELRNREGGLLEVSSSEPGATVTLDGAPVGTTSDVPIQLLLLAGDYDVRLEKAGYQPASRRLTVVTGQITTLADLAPVLRIPPMLFVVDRDGVDVLIDGVPYGRTVPILAIRNQIGGPENAALSQAVTTTGFDAASAGAILVLKPPLNRPIEVSFRRECFVEERRRVGVTTQMLEQLPETEAVLWFGGASSVPMKPDTGVLRVASTPPEADVLIDNQLVGRTPFERAVCAGTRRIRVRHKVGSFNSTVTVARDRTESVDAALRPGVAFLGAVDLTQATPRVAADLAQSVETSLAAALTTYRVAPHLEGPAGVQQWNDASAAALVVASDRGDSDTVTRLLRLAYDTFDAPLQLVAVRRPQDGTESPVDLLLFWAEHTGVDRARWLPSRPQELGQMLARLEAPADAMAFVYQNEIGLRVADAALPEAPLVVARVEARSPAAEAGVRPGDGVAAVDGNVMTTAQLTQRVRDGRPGDTLALLVIPSAGGAARPVRVPIQQRPRRGPVMDTALFGNSIVARLTVASILSRNPADREVFGFHLALLAMRFGLWQTALDQLGSIARVASGQGIGPGAILYYRARCYEGLGQIERAVALYKEASTIETEVLADDGASVGTIARRHLAGLGTAATAGARP